MGASLTKNSKYEIHRRGPRSHEEANLCVVKPTVSTLDCVVPEKGAGLTLHEE